MNLLPSLPLRANKPTLLYNDECAVCSKIVAWVKKSTPMNLGVPEMVVQPIGEDPRALKLIHPGLNIWDAYATIHLVMPDGKIKTGGEAVAEVLRKLPRTRWLAQSFSFRILGQRPFQRILNFAYTLLADVRPIFGCESCGTPKYWVKPLQRFFGQRSFGRTHIQKRPITPIAVSIPKSIPKSIP